MSRKIGILIAFASLFIAGSPRHARAQDDAYTASARVSKDTAGGLVQFNFTITKRMATLFALIPSETAPLRSTTFARSSSLDRTTS